MGKFMKCKNSLYIKEIRRLCVVLCCVVYNTINYTSRAKFYTQHIIHNTLYTLINILGIIHTIHIQYMGGAYEKAYRYCA